jgi:uncharacterized protein involved in cysteine biosynthesis
MMDVLFYYYYLCYKNVIPDVKPHLTAVWVMSVTIALIINVPINLLFIYWFHTMLDTWIMIGILGVIFLIIYLHYLKTNKWKQIIKEKPVLWNSHRLSIIFTIAFTVLGIAVLIAGMIIGKKILSS